MSLIEMLSPRIDFVNREIEKAIEGECKSLVEAMRHYPLAGGKRLRPVMALTVCSAVGGDEKEAMPLALALELTHNFTLIHDDLMDNDAIRRGIPSVHVKYGVPTAINAGDALFARSLYILTDLRLGERRFREVLRDFAKMVQGIAEGQQMDMEFEQKKNVTEEEYLVMVEKKTALMFRMAAKGGALIGGAERDVVEKMAEYGRLLGIGFQIWDDLLDLEADETKLGKPVGSDIKNGKRTLVAVWALNNLSGDHRERFLRAFGNSNATKEELRDAINALREGGAIDFARKKALWYAKKSRELLGCLPPSPDREILEKLVDYMVTREM